MVLEVCLVHDVVDKARGVGHTCSIGCRVGTVEGKMEMEVGVIPLELAEVVEIEDLIEGARAVEVVHRSVAAVESACEMHYLRTEGSHAGTTANPNHLVAMGVVVPTAVLGSTDMEVAVRAGHYDLVARLEREDIAGGYARIDVLEAATVSREGRCGDADGEHEDVTFVGIVGHGIGADGRFRIDADKVEHLEFLPSGQIFVANELSVEIAVGDAESRYLDLGIAAGDEVHVLASGELHFEFLDEGGDVPVADDGAFVFLDAEDAGRESQFEVFLHFHLTSETPSFLNLFSVEEAHLGGEDAASTFDDTTAALSAGALAATCRRQMYTLLSESGNKTVARGDGELLVTINGDSYVTLGHEFCAQHKEKCHQNEYNG